MFIAISPVRIRGVPKSALLVVLGGPRGVFGLPLGTLWAPLGSIWVPLGVSWVTLGVLWCHFEPPEGYLEGLWWFFWVSLGSFGLPFGIFGLLLVYVCVFLLRVLHIKTKEVPITRQ